jgi:formylglycine-generating enzyme required for sulfatase activity
MANIVIIALIGFVSLAPTLSYANEGMAIALPEGETLELVWIEPGAFVMGAPFPEPQRGSNEIPQHQVTIRRGFYLGKYEVTQKQWEAVTGSQPWFGQAYVQSSSSHPAVYISWNDIQHFIQKLNDLEGTALYRLPTEAEWEYACRAGTTTRWSFGDNERQLDEYAWFDVNAQHAREDDGQYGHSTGEDGTDIEEQYVHPIGMKKPNPWGLFDMHGNVWEWVQDWYGGYLGDAQVDPRGPSDYYYRVFRGGSVFDDARYTRSSFRAYNSPDLRDFNIGMRLVRMESAITAATPLSWGQLKGASR